MKNDYQQQDFVNFIKGFAIGYFAIEIICWFFKALAGKNKKGEIYI